jgi:hypothetical protein
MFGFMSALRKFDDHPMFVSFAGFKGKPGSRSISRRSIPLHPSLSNPQMNCSKSHGVSIAPSNGPEGVYGQGTLVHTKRPFSQCTSTDEGRRIRTRQFIHSDDIQIVTVLTLGMLVERYRLIQIVPFQLSCLDSQLNGAISETY